MQRAGNPVRARLLKANVKTPITISKEDYLKAVLEAESEGQAGHSCNSGPLAFRVASRGHHGAQAFAA